MNEPDDAPLDPRLRDALAALPDTLPPPRDGWPALAAALAPAAEGVVEPDPRRPPAPRRWGPAAWLAAASLLIGAAVGWFVRPIDGPPSHVAAVAAWEADVVRANDTLFAELAARDDLTPETRAAIDRNLQVIDRALAEVRAALAADPTNDELNRWLADAYDQQQRLLLSAVHLPKGS